MSKKEKKDIWLRVKDEAGNEFIAELNGYIYTIIKEGIWT
jgi:hypothetical protein